jgi:hypothetical protein
MLRDGLNFYGAIWIVNMVNMLFWFIMKPTGIDDSVKTIVTSMAAVLTTSMTLRIILSVRVTLVYGGSFAGASIAAASGTSRSTHVISTGRSHGRVGGVHTYDLSQVSKVAEGGGEWTDSDGKSSVNAPKGLLPLGSISVSLVFVSLAPSLILAFRS